MGTVVVVVKVPAFQFAIEVREGDGARELPIKFLVVGSM